MTFDLAIEAMARNVPKTWRVEPFRRHATLVDEANSKRSLPLLSLASTGIIAPRKEEGGMGRQAPSESTIERYWVAHPGNLVVNPMWLIGGGIGVSAVTGAVSPDYRVYRLGPDLHPQYVHHLLRSAPYRDQYRLYTRADTTFDRRVSKENFHPMPLLVPPLEEQRRIADFLDAETARIDRLAQLRSRQADVLEQRCRLALDQAFEKPTYQSTRLKYLLAVKPRYGVLVPQFSDTGVRFIRINDLLDLSGRADSLARIPDELSAQYSRTVTRPGDVLLSVVGTMGRSAIVPPRLAGANVARAVASLRPCQGVSPELIATWLTTPSFLRQALDVTGSDTAQPTLGMEDLSNFRLSWPINAWDRADLLHNTSVIRQHQRELSRVLQVQREVLAERRQALITAAVTGQFDVSTASGGAT